jgi:hypothetical protein
MLTRKACSTQMADLIEWVRWKAWMKQMAGRTPRAIPRALVMHRGRGVRFGCIVCLIVKWKRLTDADTEGLLDADG